MTTTWPKDRKVIGGRHKRLDGPEKTSGKAKYTQDINRPGMLYGVFLGSSHAHALVEDINTTAAEKMPGVRAIEIVRGKGSELVYAGQEVVALAADTEDQAYDALKAIKVQYKVLPHCVTVEASKAPNAPKVSNPDENVLAGRAEKTKPIAITGPDGKPTTEDFDAAMKSAAAKIDRTYTLPGISHCCLEAHGAVAEWNGDKLTVWLSTQNVDGCPNDFATAFKIPRASVTVLTHYMGGGFGSKFNADDEGIFAAKLAKKSGKPVKMMLDRKNEHSAGHRPSAYAHIKAGVDKSGKLRAFYSRYGGSPGIGASASLPLPYIYDDIPHRDIAREAVRTNQHEVRAYRAPGHPQGCYMMESAMDDLAAALGMDPLEFRLKNIPTGEARPNAKPPVKENPVKKMLSEIYRKELAIGAQLINWKGKWHPPGQGSKGPLKRGVGLGIHTWGGSAVPDEQMLVEVHPDGSVLARSSTQDLGTANRTVLAIVAAEVFGLTPDKITVEIGDSNFAHSHGSGGSTTCPSTAPATLIAATEARTALFAKLAPAFGVKPEELTCSEGKISAKGGKSMTWVDAVRKLGSDKVAALGTYKQPLNLSSVIVGGCQFAEVEVDIETGFVRCIEMVAVQDCGLIINKQGCESQVTGGVIMGVNAALFEERVHDQLSGRMLNADMEFYKLGCISDMPRIKVHMFDEPISQNRGVIGIGEPPTISTLGAIGNAVFNALGVRVANAPFTPRNVLAALAGRT